MREVIEPALKLIQRTEKRSLVAYQGKADKPGVLTIGDGHVIRPGEEWMKKGITNEQADAIFAADVAKHSEFIQTDVGAKVPLNDFEFGALASFCYNLGPRALRSAPSVVNFMRNGEKEKGLMNMYKFNISDKKYRDGLFYRRLTEIYLALKKKLIAKPEDCLEAISILKDLHTVTDTKAALELFSRNHVRTLCRSCSRKG